MPYQSANPPLGWSPTLHIDHVKFEYYLDIPDGYHIDQLIEAVNAAVKIGLDLIDEDEQPAQDIPGGVRVFLTHTLWDPFSEEGARTARLFDQGAALDFA